MDDHISTIEAGRILGLATRSIQLMVDRGELEAWKTSGGHRRISKASVERLLASRNGGGAVAAVIERQGVATDAAHAAPAFEVTQSIKPVPKAKRGPSILLIEDSLHFQRLIAAIVEDEFPDATLTMASDGITGLATFGRLQPDLLLVDIMLPGVDGAALITALRRDQMFSASRVIVVTSLDERQREPFAYALKGLPIVAKSAVPVALADAIAASLARAPDERAGRPGR